MALENIYVSDLRYDGAGSFFLYYLEADPSRSKMVENEGGKTMPILDAAIAIYLCGIMFVLGLIIVIGLIRQRANKE